MLLVVAVLVFVVTQLTLVVIPVLIALVLAAAISPLVSFLRGKGLPSLLATWVALVTLVAVLTGIVWLVVRAVVNQWGELRDQALEGFERLQAYVQDLPFQVTEEQIQSLTDSAGALLRSDAVGSG
ncbi:MAG: AI-2E family transporter, partial [Actinomycetota bacterium]|nr:AI-2E family transporter [Actinomycetota bacterium]